MPAQRALPRDEVQQVTPETATARARGGEAVTAPPAGRPERPPDRSVLRLEQVTLRDQVLRVGRTEPVPGLERTGQPLLLFNGIGASVELLSPLMTELRATPTLTFDIPGVGGSPARGLPRRAGALARLAHDLLDQYGLERVDVLGVSWGGMLAQQFALQYSERCRRLILAATSAGQLMVPASPRVLLHMATPLRYLDASYFFRVAGTIYGGDFRRDPELAHRHARLMTPPTVRGYLQQLWAIAGWTSLHKLHRITQPTLILAGRDDPIVPPINARILQARIPRARLRLFDCGHLFLLTRRAEAVAAIERFLGPHQPRPPIPARATA